MQGPSVVIGASGGIGRALTLALAARDGGRVFAFSRGPAGPFPDTVVTGFLDLMDEDSIMAAAAQVEAPVRVIVATGVLQDEALSVERSYRALEADALMRAYRLNCVGPALVAKAFLPLLPRDRPSVFAVLSARVGSISDNRLGGWHSYRASKAALNMLVKTFAIELKRERPLATCLALHPGTVDTDLSRPFQRGVPQDRLVTAEAAAGRLLQVMDTAGPEQSGSLISYTGEAILP